MMIFTKYNIFHRRIDFLQNFSYYRFMDKCQSSCFLRSILPQCKYCDLSKYPYKAVQRVRHLGVKPSGPEFVISWLNYTKKAFLKSVSQKETLYLCISYCFGGDVNFNFSPIWIYPYEFVCHLYGGFLLN